MFKTRRFVKNTSGATAIEYGLIAALVSVATVVTIEIIDNHFFKDSSKVIGRTAIERITR